MENVSLKKEKNRFAVAIAAAGEAAAGEAAAGRFGVKHVTMIDGPVDERRRSYFYAVPDGAGKYTTNELAKVLLDSDVPILVNWNRDSEKFGLRYTLTGIRIPQGVKDFQSDKARSEWVSWRDRERKIDESVLKASERAVSGKDLSFLDADVGNGIQSAPAKKKYNGIEI
jgi:hypothetical protein